MSLIPSQHDEPADAGLRQHVAIESGQHVRPEAVAQEAVAANPGVQHGDAGRGRRRLQAPRQDVRPAIVPVGRRSSAVGDRVAEDHDGPRRGRRADFDAAQEVPVIDRHGIGQARRRHGASCLEIRGGARPGVPRHVGRRAPHVDRHREGRERRQLELERVGEQHRALGNRRRRPARERQRAVGGGIDRASAGRAGDARRQQRQRRAAELVGEPHAQRPAAHRHAHDLPERRVGESRRGRQVARLHQLLGGHPRADPLSAAVARRLSARARQSSSVSL